MPRWLKWTLLALLLLAGLAVSAAWYLRTASFQCRAQAYVAARIQAATGARVSMARFHLQLHPLLLEIRGLVLHGHEAPGRPPLARIARLRLHLKLLSLFAPQIQITRLRAVRPVVHLYWTAGASNLPYPSSNSGAAAAPLFRLGIRRLILQRGAIYFSDRRLPLDFELRRLQLRLGYRRGGYAGRLSFRRSPMRVSGLASAWRRAQARFRLLPDALHLQSLQLRGSGLRLALAGNLQPLTRPQFHGKALLEARLPQFFRWWPRRDLPRRFRSVQGKFALQAGIDWQPSGWRLRGGLAAQGLRLVPSLPPVSLQSAFTATSRQIVLPRLRLTGWGGRLASTLRYQPGGRLRAQGRLDNLRLAPLVQLASLLRRRSLLPRRLRLQSRIQGAFHLSASPPAWRRLQLGLAVRFLPAPAAVAAPRPAAVLPVTGALDADLLPFASAGTLRRCRLSLAGAALDLAGSFQPSRLQLRLRLSAPRLATLQPLLAAWKIPLPQGQASAAGWLLGSFAAPRFQGTVQARHFRYAGLQLDRLQMSGVIAPDRLRLQSLALRQGSARLHAAGSIAWHRFHLQPGSRLDLSLAATRLSLARVLSLLRRPLPLRGQVNVSLRLRGTVANPQGEGRLAASRLLLWRQPVPRARAALQLDRGWLRLSHLQLTLPQGVIQGSIAYHPAGRRYSLRLSTPGIALQSIRALQSPRLRITGLLRASLDGAGDLAHPAGKLSLEGVNLRGAGESLGELQASATAANGIARLVAADQLPGGELRISAVSRLAPPYLLNARLSLQRYDADAWLRRFTALRLTGHSRLSGAIILQGPLANPRNLAAQAQLTDFEISAEDLALHNLGPVVLSMSGRRITLDRFHLAGPETDLTAGGSLGLGPALPLQLALHGSIGLALLHSFSPQTRADGRVRFDLTVGGSLRRPLPRGSLSLENATLAYSGFPLAFDALNARLRLDGNRFSIASLTARAGGGDFRVLGNAFYSGGSLHYALAILGRQLRMRYEGVSATADLDLHLAGAGRRALLTGDATLDRLALTPQFDLAVFIANRRGAGVGPATYSALNQVRLDVRLVTSPQLQVSSAAAQLQIQADLRITGSLANPILLGRIMAGEGRILFAGNYYRVVDANIEFADPFRIRPLLNLTLSTTVQQYAITLDLTGPVNHLNLSYRSNPPLSNTDIIALLATGHTAESSAGLSQQATGTFVGQSEQLLGAALQNVAANQLERMFGITRITVNPNTGGAYNTGSGSITIQQQISPKISFTYTQNLSTSSQDIVQVTWTLTRHFAVVISRDQFGIYGLSFHFHHSAR